MDADWTRLAAAAGIYRHEGSDDLFEIAVADGVPVFVSNAGPATIEQTGPNRFAPERPTMHLLFSLDGAEAIDATFCGERRRYRRLAAKPSASPHAVDGKWHHARAGVTLDITPDGSAHRLLLTSEFGALSLHLAHLDGDLFIARPNGEGSAPARPWTLTIRAAGDAVELSSDRTKRLRFLRA
jgi:hypothetical protein